MIDPFIVTILAGLGTLIIAGMFRRNWRGVLAAVGATLLFLGGITHSAGYPTNSSFPSHAIVYGLTADHVWAAPKEDPYPPRSYIFRAPPQWHEERDKRKGQPFEVEKVGEGEETRPGANPSDRTSEGPYVIHQHILPPKDEG